MSCKELKSKDGVEIPKLGITLFLVFDPTLGNSRLQCASANLPHHHQSLAQLSQLYQISNSTSKIKTGPTMVVCRTTVAAMKINPEH